jgi:hypothetical protein
MSTDRIDLSATSTEYVRVGVTGTESGVAVDPTGGAVSMAFMPTGDNTPDVTDWKTAGWETSGSNYYARALVGPTGGVVTLTPGSYRVWVKWSVAPETPIQTVGRLYVY